MRAIPRFLAPSILKSSQRGKFAPEPFIELCTRTKILDSLGSVSPTRKTLVTTYQHIWGYFKKKCTDEELHQYLKLLDELQPDNDSLGPFLVQLTAKYQIDYLQKSRLIIELNEREGQSISKN